jgi:hypothetical protein
MSCSRTSSSVVFVFVLGVDAEFGEPRQ